MPDCKQGDCKPESQRVYMVSRGEWKIGANGHFGTFWHKIYRKTHVYKLNSLISP